MPKRTVRAETLARRRELSPQQVLSLSLEVQQRFLSLPEFAAAKVLALYAPVQREVDTALVAGEALAAGKIVLYPAVLGDRLEFRRVEALSELRPGTFRIPEPQGEPYDPRAADVIVVPGVAFDICGRRIGYGKGFYDRALHSMEGSGKLVGICYECQLVQEIIGEPHDVIMDAIVTESRLVRVDKNICEGE